MKLYKLTDQNMQTHGGFQWELGEKRDAIGNGPLCSSAWLHAYTSPLLAVLMNPIHANIADPRLFEAEGDVGINDGTKVGCTTLVLVKEIKLPALSTTQRVRAAILIAKKVYANRAWQMWADGWLSGKDRGGAAADAARAAADAARAARAAADAADAARDARDADAADAAYAAADAAYAAADAAAYAAADAADAHAKKLDLHTLIEQAMKEEV